MMSLIRVISRNGRFTSTMCLFLICKFGSRPSPSKSFPYGVVVRTQVEGEGAKGKELNLHDPTYHRIGIRQKCIHLQPSDPYSQQQQAMYYPPTRWLVNSTTDLHKSCPGCPTFSILPSWPCSAFPWSQHHIGRRLSWKDLWLFVQPALNTAREFLSPDSEQNGGSANGFANRVGAVQESGQSKLPIYAGMAAIGLVGYMIFWHCWWKIKLELEDVWWGYLRVSTVLAMIYLIMTLVVNDVLSMTWMTFCACQGTLREVTKKEAL